MSISHVDINSKTTNIQLKPAFKTRAELKAGIKHNKRIGKEGDKQNIDKRLSYLNEEIRGASADQIYLNLCTRISGREYTLENLPQKEELRYAAGDKVKGNATLAYEIEASYPGDLIWSMFDEKGKIVPVPNEIEITPENVSEFFKMPFDEKEFKEWKDATVDFLEDKYGRENLLSIQVHMDENEPHIHAIGVPIIKNQKGENRLSYRDISGGPAGLRSLQTEYADSVAHLGFKRGELFSSRISDISTKEYKARLNMTLSEKLPENLEKCHDEILNLRAKNFDLDREMKQTMSSAKTIQKLRVKNHELYEEIEQIKKELEIKNQSLIIAQRTITIYRDRDEAEKIGKQLFAVMNSDNANAVANFDLAKQQMIDLGAEQMRREGKTIILSYIDDLKHYGVYENEGISINKEFDDRSEIDFK